MQNLHILPKKIKKIKMHLSGDFKNYDYRTKKLRKSIKICRFIYIEFDHKIINSVKSPINFLVRDDKPI